MAETGRRMPADRRPPIFAMRDVKGAIDQNLEDEAGAGAKFQAADAALETVTQDRELHAGELRETAGASRQVTTRMPLAVELNHGCLPLTSPWMLSETGCVQLAVEEFLGAWHVGLVQMLDDDRNVRMVL